MTDNEIIKALKKHSTDLCSNCKVEKTSLCNDCISEVERNALDLINRQKSEIEALQMDNKQLESDIIIANRNYEHIKSIWESDHQKLSRVITKWKERYKRLVIQEEDIKSEAFKEFAERLCKDRVSNDPVVIAVKVELEMAGEG